MEHLLTSVNFRKHGAIYFKKDLPGMSKDVSDLSVECSVAPEILNRFTIGPLTASEHWQSRRASMDLDRGPCRHHVP